MESKPRSLLLRRSGGELDLIFIYFMRTVLYLYKSGIEHLPLDNPLDREPLRSFLEDAMDAVLDCLPPDLGRMVLESKREAILSRGPMTAEDVLRLRFIQELALSLQGRDFDLFYDLFLSSGAWWGEAAMEYAALTFYPNLPSEVREKYQIENPIEEMQPERLRLEDY